MKSPGALPLSLGLLISLAWIRPAAAAQADRAAHTENKNITVIAAEAHGQGGAEVRKETLTDCIASLPAAKDLPADIHAEAAYLKEINGDPNRNDWMKTYTARITINYLVYQKEMLIVTPKAVQGQEPVLKEVDRRVRESQEFQSNPASGDLYSGRSNRQYYFSKPEAAVEDARHQAEVWLRQQAAVVCPAR